MLLVNADATCNALINTTVLVKFFVEEQSGLIN